MQARKIIITALTGIAAAIAVVGPAWADTVVYVDGGKWHYGADSQHGNFSNYVHNGRNHGSSVENLAQGIVRSNCAPPTVWSAAQERYSVIGGNKAYYRFC